MSAEFTSHSQAKKRIEPTPATPPVTADHSRESGARAGLPLFLQTQPRPAQRQGDSSAGQLAVQAELTVTQSDDVYEKEARRLSELATAASPPALPPPDAPAAPNGDPPGNGLGRRVQRYAGPTAAAGNLTVPERAFRDLGAGQPLPSATRGSFESFFGQDLSDVRVHTDVPSAASARAINARAYTVGRDIVFGSGHYAPSTGAGQKLLVHELTHVIQQGGARGLPIIQRDTEVSTSSGTGALATIGIAAYDWIQVYGAQLVRELSTQLQSSSFTLPVSEMSWHRGLADFVPALLAPLAGDASNVWSLLPFYMQPDSLADAVNVGRDVSPSDRGTVSWSPGVVSEVARRVSLRVMESITRVAPRVARHRARDWNPVVQAGGPAFVAPSPVLATPLAAPSTPPLALGDLRGGSLLLPFGPILGPAGAAFSHPIDPFVYTALRSSTDIDIPAYRTAHPDEFTAAAIAAEERPLRSVHFDFLANQGLPSWIRVSEPYDATVEEVANTLYGTPTAAYRLAAAPPLFGLPADDIPTDILDGPTAEDMLRDPSARGTPAERREARPFLLIEHQFALLAAMRQAGIQPGAVRTGAGAEREILASPMGDQAALQAAARIMPTPGVSKDLIRERMALIHNALALMVAPAGELSRPPDAPALTIIINTSTGQITREPFDAPESQSMRARVESARERVLARFNRISGASDAEAVAWDGQSRGQLEIVSTAQNGLSIAAGLAAHYRGWPHIYDLIRSIADAYVGAAEISDLYPAARARLDLAERRSVLFPVTALELWLAQIRAVLDAARTSAKTTVPVDPRTAYFVSDMDRQEQELRDQLAQVRAQLIQDPAAAQATLQRIFADVQSLQTGSSLALNLDTVDQVWQALYDSLSFMGEIRSWFPGEHGNDILSHKMASAHQLGREWHAILLEWRYGDRELARQQLEKKAQGEWKTWVNDMAEVIRDQQTWDRLMTFAAMVGIAILSGGIGAYVEAAAGAAWGVGAGASAWVELGAAGVGVATEATVFTTLSYPLTTNDPSLSGFAGQFGQNLLFFGGGRVLARGFQGLLGEARAATAGGRLATTGVVAAGFTGVNLVMANAQSQRRQGRSLSGGEAAEVGLENVAFIGATTLASALLRRPLTNLKLEGELAGLNFRHTGALRTLQATMTEVSLAPDPPPSLRQRLIADTQRAVQSEQALANRMSAIVARADALVKDDRPGSEQARDRELERFGISADLAGQLRSGTVQSQVLAGLRAMQGVRISRALEPVGTDFTIHADLYQEALGYFRSLPDTVVFESGRLTLIADPNAARAPLLDPGGESFLVQPQGDAPFRVYRRAAGAVADIAGRVELAPSVEAVAGARDPMARPAQPGGGRAGASEIDWGLPAEGIEGARRALIGRGDIDPVMRSMRDAGIPVGREQLQAVKRYLFDSQGIAFDRANVEAWQRLASRRGQVRDIAFLVHELAEIRALEEIRRQTGFDYRGANFENMNAGQRQRWQADFTRYYLQAHSEALAAEYRYVADAVGQATNGRVRIGRNIAAAVDPTRGEARTNMLVDGRPLSAHPDFATWQARAGEVAEIGAGAQERLRLPTQTPTLAELVAAVKRSAGGPEAAAARGQGVSLLAPEVSGSGGRRGRSGAEAGDQPRIDALLDTLSPPMAQRFRDSGHARALLSAPNVLDFLTRPGELHVRPFERFIVESRLTPAEAIPILDDLLAAHPTTSGVQLEAWATAIRGAWDVAPTDVNTPAARLRAALLVSRQSRYAANPVQAVADLRALLADNVELMVAVNELTRASDFGAPETAPVAGPGSRGPDVRLTFAGRPETVGREMYATDLDTPSSASVADAQAQLGDTLMRGVRNKAIDYTRADVPAFTRREVGVQIRRSRGGYNFDAMLTQPFLDSVMQRLRINPDTVRYRADILDRVVFYNSRGDVAYIWNR